MKHPLDNQTQDWVHLASHKNSASSIFDLKVLYMSLAVNSNRKLSTRDFVEITGLHIRSAQRHLSALTKSGFLQKDNEVPAGYTATEKAKTIFKGAA